MLVIVRDKEGYFYLATDTRKLLFDIKTDSCIDDNCLIFNAKTNSKVIMATTDNNLFSNFAKNDLELPGFRQFDYDTLYSKLVPSVLKQAINKNIIEFKEEVKLPEEMVFAKEKQAFVLRSHCSLYEINSFDILGCGILTADASLKKSAGEEDTLKRVFKAFYETEKTTNYVGRNIYVVHTKGAKPKIKLYKEEDILKMYPDLDY